MQMSKIDKTKLYKIQLKKKDGGAGFKDNGSPRPEQSSKNEAPRQMSSVSKNSELLQSLQAQLKTMKMEKKNTVSL